VAGLIERARVEEFLTENPRLALRPCRDGLLIKGLHSFHVKFRDLEIKDAFEISISIPESFPKELPSVVETGQRIPRWPEFHVNPDGTLCVGSPVRILTIQSQAPTIQGYVQRCVNPYLAAISHKLKHGGDLIFGELEHGAAGELADYASLLGLKSPSQVRQFMTCLSHKRRVANKRPCPCSCGRRLGKCRLNERVLPLRKMASRRWFKERAQHLA
jgi:hypothetical protein